MDEGITEAVFRDEDFLYVERKVLYHSYKQLTLRSGKKPVGENKFVAMVEGWLKAHRPEIETKEVWFDKPRKGRRRVWYDTSKPNIDTLTKRASVCRHQQGMGRTRAGLSSPHHHTHHRALRVGGII